MICIALASSGFRESRADDTVEEAGSPGLGERLQISGTAELGSAIETRDGSIQKFQLRLQPEFEAPLSDDVNLTVIPMLRFDPADKLAPGQPGLAVEARLFQAAAQAGVPEPEIIHVLEPEDGLIGIGSGGAYALSAARALVGATDMDAEEIAARAMKIAAGICVYTNESVVIEKL